MKQTEENRCLGMLWFKIENLLNNRFHCWPGYLYWAIKIVFVQSQFCIYVLSRYCNTDLFSRLYLLNKFCNKLHWGQNHLLFLNRRAYRNNITENVNINSLCTQHTFCWPENCLLLIALLLPFSVAMQSAPHRCFRWWLFDFRRFFGSSLPHL